MAEIKSTMEMVLARADRFCKEAGGTVNDESLLHEGMKAGAAFLNGETMILQERIPQLSGGELHKFTKGVLQTFMRNINLPRDESSSCEDALGGLAAIAKAWPTPKSTNGLDGLLQEIRTILGRYFQHREQILSQLKENFAMQIAHLEQSMAQQTGMKMKISPEQHPKFQEEWQRTVAQLNNQYVNALDQYKDAVSKIFQQE